MIRTPIRDKQTMYRLLQDGALGNTIAIYPSLYEWQQSSDLGKYDLWGVRCYQPGDPRMRLNVPREEVWEYVYTNFPDHKGYNISPMIDRWCYFKGEVMEETYPPFSLYLYGAFGTGTWREQLRDHGKHYHGLTAKTVLEHVCNPNSYDDIRDLLHLYPGHVVEFSACDRPVGKIPTRNAVIWEVRAY